MKAFVGFLAGAFVAIGAGSAFAADMCAPAKPAVDKSAKASVVFSGDSRTVQDANYGTVSVPVPGAMDWDCGWCEDGRHHHPSVWAVAMEKNGNISPGSMHITCPSGYYPPSETDGRPSRATAEMARHEIGKYLTALGNPNLQVGKAIDKGDYFEVQVVTRNSSTVDVLFWDKDFVGFYCDCPFHQDLRLKLRGKLETKAVLFTETQAKEAAARMAGVSVNPNLAIGKSTLKGQIYIVEVQTKDGSLVDRYEVDAKTGQVRSAYQAQSAASSRPAISPTVSAAHSH